MFRKVFITGVLFIAIGGIGALLTGKSYFSAAEREKSATNFADAIIDEIDVWGDLGSLTIQPTAGDAVIVESIGPKKGEPIKTELVANTLTVSATKQNAINFGINFNEQATDIIIHLPEKTYQQITADNEVGSIEITGIRAKKIQSESEVGDITIKDSTGELVLKNEVGNIDVEVPAIGEPITASNEIGNISISVSEVPENHYISASSEIGSIQIFDKKTNSYMSGNGRTAVDLKTEIGDIDLTN
jgi:Putative adhesin